MSKNETNEVKRPRRLFNKGQRVIVHDNQPAPFDRLAPQKQGSFTDEEAAKLLRLYGDELIDMDNVKIESLISDAANTAQRAVEGDGREFQSQIAARKKAMRDNIAANEYQKAIAEGFSVADARELVGWEPLSASDMEAVESAPKAKEAEATKPAAGAAKTMTDAAKKAASRAAAGLPAEDAKEGAGAA